MVQSIKPPLIGITTYGQKETGKFYVPGSYVNAVVKAGGVPLLLPPVQTDLRLMLEPLDGVVLIGGGDIDPCFYDGSDHPEVYGVDSQRDTFEIALTRLVLQHHIPTLGLCRGLQIMMVASGGDIVPHLPDQFGEDIIHRSDKESPHAQHPVKLLRDSKLAAIMQKTQVTVVSLHHQAVRTVPPGWRVSGWADDGLPEALEHENHPFAIAVQWHPELSPDDPDHQHLFRAFIKAAQSRKAAIAA